MEVAMALQRIIRVSVFSVSLLLLLSFAGTRSRAEADGSTHCVPVGGTFMTNLAAIGGTSVPSTTLGRVTGDLSGAVAATIENVQQTGNTFVFTVQHHIVTDEGDFVNAREASATTVQVPGATPPLFAIVTYPVTIIPGGTGKFANATGMITNIGEVQVPGFATGDLSGGTLILRYSGNICFPAL
jgi:hypothetical protein